MRRQSSVFVALAHSTNVLSINSGPVLGHHQQLAGGRQELRHLNRPLSVDFRNTTDGSRGCFGLAFESERLRLAFFFDTFTSRRILLKTCAGRLQRPPSYAILAVAVRCDSGRN
jgi:hypothetical protein